LSSVSIRSDDIADNDMVLSRDLSGGLVLGMGLAAHDRQNASNPAAFKTAPNFDIFCGRFAFAGALRID
jgi:hypothetical protein